MAYPSNRQPKAIKFVNLLGRCLQKLEIEKPSMLPIEALITKAFTQTGLNDFGDESFFPALEKLAVSLEREARLSQLGRIAAHAMLLDNLKLRLSLTDYRKQRPEIAQQTIKRPLFVLGLPRTGTTILYELLAQDPAHRSPSTWEVAQPIPPAQHATFHSDPRIPVVEKTVQKMESLAPGFQAIHAMGARLPQECVT